MKRGLSSSHSALYPTIVEVTECIEEQFPAVVPLGPGERSCSGQTNMVVIYANYVARVHNPDHDYRTEEYFSLEVQVLSEAANRGISVPEVVGLFEWSLGSGTLFKRYDGITQSPTDANARVIAPVAASIHKHLRRVFSSSSDQQRVARVRGARDQQTPEEVLSTAAQVRDALQQHFPFGKDASYRYAALVDRLVSICSSDVDGIALSDQLSVLPCGVVHGDLNSGNWLWNSSDRSNPGYCLLDWDFFTYECFLKDISYILMSWCSNEHTWLFERAKTMMHAYESIRPLEKEEILRLPQYTALAWLKSCCFMFHESQRKMPHINLIANHFYTTLTSMCSQTGELNFHNAFVISEMHRFRLHVKSFFVSWCGSVTLAFSGWPQSVLRFKESLCIRGHEFPGSKWPKITLGRPKEGVELTMDEVLQIQKTVIDVDAPLVIGSLSIVTFSDIRLYKNLHETQFQLKGQCVSDDFFVTAHTDRVLDESQDPRYIEKVHMKGKSLKCARDQTLVAFLRNQPENAAILGKIQGFMDSWEHRFDFFPMESLHVTLTALPH